MTVLLVVHLVVGAMLLIVGARAARWTIAAAAVPPVATLAWLTTRLPDIVDGEIVDERLEWVPALGLGLDLRLDGFSASMILLISGIGLLVVLYSAGYFGARPTGRTPGLIGLLTLFAGAMVGLVLADNLLAIYGFWELTSITSFLLIGNKHEDTNARTAALQALLTTGLGGLAMLGGFIVIGIEAGTYRLSELLAAPPDGGVVEVALVLVLLGALTKSAQVPFHSWLPGAMVAPTPVSAYLHSATMVKAGVYLVARFSPAFTDASVWRPILVTVGASTMIIGGLRALRQTDLKLLLAMSTISQLGFMMTIFAWGTHEAIVAGSVLLLAHGAFKAAAFMVVGIIDHQCGTRDVRALPRFSRGWRLTAVVTVVAAASMAGVPLTFGFIAKESVFTTYVDDGSTGAAVTLALLVVGSALTVGYSIRFALGACGWLSTGTSADPATAPRATFVAPAAILTVVTALMGLWPGLLDGLESAVSGALTSVSSVHLALWHGLNLPLALSAVALLGGVGLAVAGPRLGPILALGARVPSANAAYLLVLRGLNATANRVTSIAQPGSLPVYLGVILITATLVPGVLLLREAWWPGWPEFVNTPVHLPIAALLLGFALAAAVVRRRFSAALFLGMVGYAMAGLFVAQGAPDLALTQVAIETLTTVLFVLVLRRLPDRFEAGRTNPRRNLRRAIAVGVGTIVFFFTLAFAGQPSSTEVSDTMIADAYPEAEGRNVVNVILVDFRGFDTMGEITVLTAAAIGTVALARAGRRKDFEQAPPGGEPQERVPPPLRLTRLLTLEVSVRVVFAAIVAASLWLLFAGHNQPGGGFVGGIVAGAAISLRYVAGGIAEVRSLSRGQPWLVLGSGVMLAVGTAAAPLAFGNAVLESGSWTLDPPLIGTMKLTTALVFDIGVYLAVIGLAMMVFESFGDDSAEERA